MKELNQFTDEELEFLIEICNVYLYEDHVRKTPEFDNLLAQLKELLCH